MKRNLILVITMVSALTPVMSGKKGASARARARASAAAAAPQIEIQIEEAVPATILYTKDDILRKKQLKKEAQETEYLNNFNKIRKSYSAEVAEIAQVYARMARTAEQRIQRKNEIFRKIQERNEKRAAPIKIEHDRKTCAELTKELLAQIAPDGVLNSSITRLIQETLEAAQQEEKLHKTATDLLNSLAAILVRGKIANLRLFEKISIIIRSRVAQLTYKKRMTQKQHKHDKVATAPSVPAQTQPVVPAPAPAASWSLSSLFGWSTNQ